MSAYAHQMERSYSVRTISSRGNSEMNSNYEEELGYYMSSFAAAIFIGALVTVGVLLITLVITLAVMLQSCENKNSGVVELQKFSDDHSMCHVFSQHAELNGLDAHDCPLFCHDMAIQYIKGGQYARELNITMSLVRTYFNVITAPGSVLDMVLMDADDILSSNPLSIAPFMSRFGQFDRDSSQEARNLKHTHLLKLYTELQVGGWSLVLLSRKPNLEQNATTGILHSAGFSNWSSLIMRSDIEMRMDSRAYFSRRRKALEEAGYKISGVVSSQMDVLTGPFLGKRIFKIPNPICVTDKVCTLTTTV